MTDIAICPCCGNSAIGEYEEKRCGISFRYGIECLVCGYTIEKVNKRAAYKAWKRSVKKYMTDKKPTDNEIIKALECCNNGWCDGRCPYYGREDIADCREQSGADQLDLINRQKAEIERLTKCRKEEVEKLMSATDKVILEAKAEAIKEFAERLKEKSKQGKGYLGNVYHSVDVAEIDNLLKEMVGDNNA